MDNIRVGVSATLSGKYSLQGIDSFNGLKLWVDFVNSTGGIPVRDLAGKLPVDLIFFDDESIPENAAEITEKLIRDEGVDILLGPYSSSLTVAAAGISEKFNRVLWNYGGSTDELQKRGYKNIVSAITPASSYLKPYINYLSSAGGEIDGVAIIFAKDSGFASEVVKGTIERCKDAGIRYAAFGYESGTTDFNGIIDQIRKQKIKYLVGVGRFEDDIALAGNIENFNSCLVGAGIGEFKNVLGEKSEGFMSVSQWEPNAGYKADFGISSEHFTNIYNKKYGKIPDYTAAQSFNMGNIIRYFIEKTGSVDEKEQFKIIKDGNFTTFYGKFKIDTATGAQTGHETLLTQWQSGKKEIIYPPEHLTSEIWIK